MNLPAPSTESVNVPTPARAADIPTQGRMNGRPRFAGEALRNVAEQPYETRFSRKRGLDNPQMGLIKNPAAVRAEQTPGGDLEPTVLEGFDV